MKRFSETEDELVRRIPVVRGLCPIVVEPETIVVVFEVEDVRVAVGVGIVHIPIRATIR